MERLTGGAKRKAVLEPLPTKGFPRSTPERMIRWIQTFIIPPRGIGARKPMRLAPFQKQIIREVFGDPNVRSALASLPRGNGKTSLSAALALYALFDETVDDPEVLAVASDERTAGILLETCRRMVQLNPLLDERVIGYKDKLVCPMTSGVLRALPATESALHGWNPSYLSLDELHVCTEPTWTACITAAGKRERSIVLAISTPAISRESVMYSLVELGHDGSDPSFKLIEYAAPSGCAVDDEAAWRAANPAIAAGFLKIEGIRSTLATTRESRFRQLRLGQWVDGGESSWVSWEAWTKCALPGHTIPDGATVVLSFDGSVRADSTVLVATTVPSTKSGVPFVQILNIWERDKRRDDWQVPRTEVDAAVRQAFAQFNVLELCADPAFWQSELAQWSQEWPGRIVEFPTNSPSRMAVAVDAAWAAIQSGRLEHDGGRTLAVHVANCRVRETTAGAVITKESKWSENRIDAAVAMVLGVARSLHYQLKEPAPLGGMWAV